VERKIELNYSQDQRLSGIDNPQDFGHFSAVIPPVSRRKSAGFCTPYSRQIRRFSASFPHDLNIIFTHITMHNFSATFSQEIAGSAGEKNGEKAAVRREMRKIRGISRRQSGNGRFPPSAFGVRQLDAALKGAVKPAHSKG